MSRSIPLGIGKVIKRIAILIQIFQM